MAKLEIFLCPPSSQQGQGSRGKLFLVLTYFVHVVGQNMSLPSNLPPKMALLLPFFVTFDTILDP